MVEILNLYKKVGETPLECINRFRTEHPEYKALTLSYAGRLDPMADGVLVVLVGDENKNRAHYLNLTKEYTTEILCGITSDTYDILGLVTAGQDLQENFEFTKDKIKNKVRSLIGTMRQKYPIYSSRTVKGKPLFEWAREGRLSEIEIPDHEIKIYDVQILDWQMITIHSLRKTILEKIQSVKGDFRQLDILQSWESFFEKNIEKSYPILKLHISCSTGTYIRGIANDLGQSLHQTIQKNREEHALGALAYSITRTKIGPYNLENSIY